MNRALPSIPVLAACLALAACNRSAGGQPPADLLLTGVAATLTAAPTLPPGSTQSPFSAQFISATPPPSATSIIGPSPTQAALPSITLTVSPTYPPLPPGDPRTGINLSAPDYRDDFSNDLTWVGPSFEGATNVWDSGRLRAVDHLPDSYFWWSTTVPDADTGNLYAEVTAQIGPCSGKDSYGLGVRVGGAPLDSGYTLDFSCDGSYRMQRLVTGVSQVLVDWTPSSGIHAGPNTSNRLGVLARGQDLYMVANGTVLDHLGGADYGVGTFGLFANSEETPDLTVYFDDFALWRLAP